MRCATIVATALAGLLLTVEARATITFDGLTGGSNESAFPSPYTEDGFTVTATAGGWFEAQVFGNPVPSIFAGPIGSPTISTIDVTGGMFLFSSVDLVSNSAAGSTYHIVGSLGGSTVLDQTGTIGDLNQFDTILSISGATLDDLMITLTPGNGTTSMNIDNIDVSVATPEPVSMTVLGSAIFGLGLIRRRRA